MGKHIILTAFGTTSSAKSTYKHLDSVIGLCFPDCQIHWSFSSPTIRKTLSGRRNSHKNSKSLAHLLENLNRNQANRVVIQSVHVMPGYEFHRIVRESQKAAMPHAIGMPLLTTPEDFNRVGTCLAPQINEHRHDAILILGHGTSHPSWTAYPTLENVLRRQAGPRIFVAALEKYPDSGHVIEDISDEGFRQVLIIPFLMVAGMHFQRDIVSDDPMSWKSRLSEKNITMELHNQGLGMLPGIAEIICDHITHSFTSLTD